VTIPKTGVPALILAWSLIQPSPAQAQADILQSPGLEASVGWMAPQGNLDGALDPTPQAGLRFTTSYYGDWRAHGQFRYCHLDGSETLASAHLAQAGAGLQWQSPASWWWPALGAGLGLYYVRVDEKKPPDRPYLFLDDGESEFGFYPFAAWQRPLAGSLYAHWGVQWDIIWSAPDKGHLLSLHAGLGWQWP
jgi:hypothetical protein